MTTEQWRSRIVRHADADPAELKANPQNWRTHPPAQREALAQTLDEVGWVQDIVVNKTTGHVVDGHLRIELALERGEATVPVVYVVAAVRFRCSALIVWDKGGSYPVGRSHYHFQHEPCWFAVREGATASWVGDRKQTTVWAMPPVRAGDEDATGHGTQKPVECMERPIRNHEGDVYDPFVGSGTTLIAAERTGRACYAMDIEPGYVQVSIDRWEAYTGGTAVLLDDDTGQ